MRLPFSALSFCLASAAVASAAPSGEPASNDLVGLEPLVVSAGFDEKTAFDLAQGATILVGADLRRRAADTLGETLDGTAGVASSAYGPGASRPIIRGLGGDRVRVLESGTGTLDASNISPDHAVATEPLFARRIEVLRGPATLLFGSSAIGGVVNVVDNRIPERPAERPFAGTLEARAFGPAETRAGLAAVGGGSSRFAFQIDALESRASDLRIPGVARIDANAPATQPAGVLPNSDVEITSGSVGGTWFGAAGHFGAAVSTFDTEYGVPVDEPISIRLRRHRLDLHAEITQPAGVFAGARAQFSLAEYEHRELLDRRIVNTTFTNQAWEGRLELPHEWGPAIQGTWGAQAARSDFAAAGEEVATPPSVTTSAALFAVEEWKRGPLALQVGGRIERQSIALGDVPADLPPVPGFAATSGERRTRTGVSGSTGVVLHPASDWSVALALAYSERLPTAQELFSNGPHGGTAAWEIGRADLGPERSIGVDVSVRKRAGFFSGAVSGFANRFRGFVFEQRLPEGTIPAEFNHEGLTPYQFTAKDALFSGGEAELVLHLLEQPRYLVHLQLTSDYVHAQQTSDHEPLPRIPPLRFGAALRFDSAHWHAGVEARATGRQNRTAPLESPTAGYALLNADVTYTLPAGTMTYEFFARGTNLTNAEARLHSSFLKDFAPLAGRGLLLGLRALF